MYIQREKDRKLNISCNEIKMQNILNRFSDFLYFISFVVSLEDPQIQDRLSHESHDQLQKSPSIAIAAEALSAIITMNVCLYLILLIKFINQIL